MVNNNYILYYTILRESWDKDTAVIYGSPSIMLTLCWANILEYRHVAERNAADWSLEAMAGLQSF